MMFTPQLNKAMHELIDEHDKKMLEIFLTWLVEDSDLVIGEFVEDEDSRYGLEFHIEATSKTNAEIIEQFWRDTGAT